jgi:hypothetical protein
LSYQSARRAFGLCREHAEDSGLIAPARIQLPLDRWQIDQQPMVIPIPITPIDQQWFTADLIHSNCQFAFPASQLVCGYYNRVPPDRTRFLGSSGLGLLNAGKKQVVAISVGKINTIGISQFLLDQAFPCQMNDQSFLFALNFYTAQLE